jgi:hypothetical protein
MTFEEILDQAIVMLQRRGRLTYGALKRQFNLDDAYLEDLKAELIEGQRLAVDEDGRVVLTDKGRQYSDICVRLFFSERVKQLEREYAPV